MPIEQAISKVRSEMTQNTANSYIQVVGGFLLQHLEVKPQDAEKILAADKTIAKSLTEMRKEAEKKSGNCAMFTPQEGFTIVLKYFGIDAVAPTTAPMVHPEVISEKVIQPNVSAPNPKIDFDIKLEDLL